MQEKVLYVGLDVHKASISVTVAEEGRDGAVRFIGAIPNTPTDIAKLAHQSPDVRQCRICPFEDIKGGVRPVHTAPSQSPN